MGEVGDTLITCVLNLREIKVEKKTSYGLNLSLVFQIL